MIYIQNMDLLYAEKENFSNLLKWMKEVTLINSTSHLFRNITCYIKASDDIDIKYTTK